MLQDAAALGSKPEDQALTDLMDPAKIRQFAWSPSAGQMSRRWPVPLQDYSSPRLFLSKTSMGPVDLTVSMEFFL